MISLKDFFRIGFSTVAMIFLLISCNSGSKDTIPAVNDNSSSTTNSDSIGAVATPTVDSATAVKTETTESANSKAETHVVTIENMKFNPATITVNKGDQVTFINKDIVGRNATEIKNAWASPMLETGKSWTFTPGKTSDYYCTVHLVMKGKSIVK
ncbi:hypothetical protein FNJ88_00790 [Chryseobacterium sp. SNU WT5]|uniref:plastocyanin/azurin family copper-binding protein n=1 Tax=Chryseobacterium sp. SNU WT5 TaxID=2594269 RepID=UPI00117D4C43|nr:plastocyanin/azurin family copper-binding protein [Chryseobacterium sp. SNU WT5]QDP84162.1 hypothetical protein FNJ88_00790 [Chryseobacterium sp. SNU WT5]